MAKTAVKLEMNPTATTAVEDENDINVSRSSSCESEILRNRLLCTSFPSGGRRGYDTSQGIAQNTASPVVVTMSSSSSIPTASYPKCNISLTMSGSSEQLSVITTSIASAGESCKPVGVLSGSNIIGNSTSVITTVPSYCNQQLQFQLNKDKLPKVDIKPIIVGVAPAPLLQSTCSLTAATASSHAPVMEVKKEPAVLEISYDRDRILTFLTDYWKSKNLQQVTEAQQQTAGVSGVASSDFCPAPQRIVEEALFDLFVEYPMMIDGLAISKRAWAKAFYEKDIIQTSKVLFEALFSEQEMQQCTLNGKKGTPELSAIKMLAILRTAAWMKNKKQDPYSFNTNIASHNQFPTNEEREKIEKKVFTERRSQANRKLTKTSGNSDSATAGSSATRDTTTPESQNQGSPAPKADSPPSSTIGASPAGENRLSLSEDFRREHMAPLAKIPRLDLDTEIVKQLQMLYAENPEGLISYLLPNTRAILIDGFLIPHEDWTKAFNETGSDIVKAAWTLFKVLFSKTEILNCTLNGKNGTRELCPVKKLAILRAITWMKENQGTSIDIFSFNVRRSEFNCFPSDEDKDKIETKVYTEKRYQACRKLKGQLM